LKVTLMLSSATVSSCGNTVNTGGPGEKG
jgi:predicted small secreted protein